MIFAPLLPGLLCRVTLGLIPVKPSRKQDQVGREVELSIFLLAQQAVLKMEDSIKLFLIRGKSIRPLYPVLTCHQQG